MPVMTPTFHLNIFKENSWYRVLFSSFILLTACQSNGTVEQTISDVINFEVEDQEAGKIVHQSSTPLGNDFYKVMRSIENSPTHWEGTRHLSFIFFKEKKICQCDERSSSISPQGKYIIYVNQSQSGNLEIYDTKNNKVKTLSSNFIGYPRTSNWQINDRAVNMELDNLKGDISNREFSF